MGTSMDSLTAVMRTVNRPPTGWPILTLPCGPTDYTLTVSDGALVPPDAAVMIDDETIYIASVANNIIQIDVDGRGKEDTTAAAHAAGARVRPTWTTRHHMLLAAALISTQINPMIEELRSEVRELRQLVDRLLEGRRSGGGTSR